MIMNMCVCIRFFVFVISDAVDVVTYGINHMGWYIYIYHCWCFMTFMRNIMCTCIHSIKTMEFIRFSWVIYERVRFLLSQHQNKYICAHIALLSDIMKDNSHAFLLPFQLYVVKHIFSLDHWFFLAFLATKEFRKYQRTVASIRMGVWVFCVSISVWWYAVCVLNLCFCYLFAWVIFFLFFPRFECANSIKTQFHWNTSYTKSLHTQLRSDKFMLRLPQVCVYFIFQQQPNLVWSIYAKYMPLIFAVSFFFISFFRSSMFFVYAILSVCCLLYDIASYVRQ